MSENSVSHPRRSVGNWNQSQTLYIWEVQLFFSEIKKRSTCSYVNLNLFLKKSFPNSELMLMHFFYWNIWYQIGCDLFCIIRVVISFRFCCQINLIAKISWISSTSAPLWTTKLIYEYFIASLNQTMISRTSLTIFMSEQIGILAEWLHRAVQKSYIANKLQLVRLF